MRREARNEESNFHLLHTSPRLVLTLIRLSTAIAKLRFAKSVDKTDVVEALRLIEASRKSIKEEKLNLCNKKDIIYEIITNSLIGKKSIELEYLIKR